MIRIFILTAVVAAAAFSQEFTKAIEDNSFFIEEAYNQEERVVQHIFTFMPAGIPSDYEASFTQEWPVFGRTHQFSVTIPYIAKPSPEDQGIGDILLNYRYQAIDEPGLAFAPRVSLVLPSGDNTKGFGNNSTGLQINLPLSKRFSDEIVTHGNAGLTYLPTAKLRGSTVTFSEYFIGGSVIYLANKSFNVMAELLYTNEGSSFGRSDNLMFSPGMRWAIDIGGLQIVPGLAFQYSITGNGWGGVFLYLSFEHPY